ncbi:MAG: DinB family protein [Anaerolineaceae bacterium]|nr:DinB family protein [Anaerolineaceae bacterium]
MLAFFEVYDKMLSELLERMNGAFSDLSEDALDWTPDPAVNSITVLVVHTTAALQYWIGAMLGDEDAKRDRGEEFTVRGYSKFQLHELIHAAEATIHRVLENCTMEELEKKSYSVIHKEYFDGAFSLAHALEHTALHLGHLEIMRELWEQLDWGQKGSSE